MKPVETLILHDFGIFLSILCLGSLLRITVSVQNGQSQELVGGFTPSWQTYRYIYIYDYICNYMYMYERVIDRCCITFRVWVKFWFPLSGMVNTENCHKICGLMDLNF